MRSIDTARPVFMVGLPRSGSTLLSRLVNESPDILSVNDLYFLQAVIADNALEGVLDEAQAARLADSLLEVIDTRANANNEFIGQFRVSPEAIARIREKALAAHRRAPMAWNALMDALLADVAAEAGKTRWADKTPQNFLHAERLIEAFPNARFVYLLRDPADILSSYKFASGEGHDRRRYHPWVYARYWVAAVERYEELKAAFPERFLLVRYEDLVARPAEEAARIAGFIGTTITPPALGNVGHNSSFSGKARQTIGPAEQAICARVCGKAAARYGYRPAAGAWSVGGVASVVALTFRFAFFQGLRLVQSRDARARVMAVLGRLVK